MPTDRPAWVCDAVSSRAAADLSAFIADRCETGALKVRIALMDPDCEETRQRDDLERLGGSLPARIRTTLRHLEPLRACPGLELRFVEVPLYNAVDQFDDQMLVTPYLYAKHGFQHPLLHLRRLAGHGLFVSDTEQFEALWLAARPAPHQDS